MRLRERRKGRALQRLILWALVLHVFTRAPRTHKALSWPVKVIDHIWHLSHFGKASEQGNLSFCFPKGIRKEINLCTILSVNCK